MGYRVLIVEDDSVTAIMLSRMLERLGCTVLATVNNSAEAEAFFANQALDLVFMDTQLNGEKDGIKLAQSLLRYQPGVRVIFLSANTDQLARQDALSLKPMAFLPKPVATDELANVLQAMGQMEIQYV